MRAFVAMRLDEPAQIACAGLVDRCVARAGAMLRPIPARSAHLTLAFMASLPTDAIDEAVEGVRDAAASHSAIAASLGAPEILKVGREVRLVHAPVNTGRVPLARLAAEVGAALSLRLPDVEVRATPAPHVTLARFRRGTRWRDVHDLAAWLAQDLGEWQLSVQLNAIHVIESVLVAGGPRYVDRAAVPLGSGT